MGRAKAKRKEAKERKKQLNAEAQVRFDVVIGAVSSLLVYPLFKSVTDGSWYSSGALWTLVIGLFSLLLISIVGKKSSPIRPYELLLLLGFIWIGRWSLTDGSMMIGGFLIGALALESQRFRRGALSFAVSLCAIGVVAATQHLQWPLGHINYLAMLTGITWCYFLGEQQQKGWRQKPSLGLIIMSLSILVLCTVLGRGQSILLCTCMIGFLTYRNLAFRGRLLMALSMLVIVGLFSMLPDLRDPLIQKFNNSRFAARLDIFAIAISGIGEAPFFGHGVWGMHWIQESKALLREQFWSHEKTNLSNAHNLGLHSLVQMGSVGLLLISCVFAFFIRSAIRCKQAKARLILYPLLAWFIIGQVSIAVWTVSGLVAFGVFMGWLVRSHGEPKWIQSTQLYQSFSIPKPIGIGVTAAFILTFAIARPCCAQWVSRAELRYQEFPLAWLVWNEQTYNRFFSYTNKRLMGAKKYPELAKLWQDAITEFGPRLNGWGRISMASYFAKDRHACVEFALKQYKYHPLSLANEEDRRFFRQAFKPPYAKETRKLLLSQDVKIQRNFTAIMGRGKVAPKHIHRLLKQEELDLFDISFLLAIGYERKDVDLELRQKCMAYVLAQFPSHGDIKRHERKLRAQLRDSGRSSNSS